MSSFLLRVVFLQTAIKDPPNGRGTPNLISKFSTLIKKEKTKLVKRPTLIPSPILDCVLLRGMNFRKILTEAIKGNKNVTNDEIKITSNPDFFNLFLSSVRV